MGKGEIYVIQHLTFLLKMSVSHLKILPKIWKFHRLFYYYTWESKI